MIKKIISGGQTGADRAGLIVAKEMGIETGGWMPFGFIAHDGKHPEFALLYNIKEHKSFKYPPRTAVNVKESDGTVRFASNFNSPGVILTLKMINQYKKPYFDIDINNPVDIDEFRLWLKKNNINVLNVAGNSESSSPGIEFIVKDYLRKSLQIVRNKL